MAAPIRIEIKRQDGPGQPARWETFEVPFSEGMNVISALQHIQRNPKTADGQATTPVVWDCNCLEEVCGACTMIIDGKVRQSCSRTITKPGEHIKLEPMTKFPLVRDLMVDRKRFFDDLRKVKAWIPVQGAYDLGPGPRQSPAQQEDNYKFSECMTCGCCLEACPQYGPSKKFVGPAVLGQVKLMNGHPTGAMNAPERLHAIMGDGGIEDCGNAQNCIKACPKGIPLTDAIGQLGRDTAKQWFRDLFAGKGKTVHKTAAP